MSRSMENKALSFQLRKRSNILLVEEAADASGAVGAVVAGDVGAGVV